MSDVTGEPVRSSAFLELIGPMFFEGDRARPRFHAVVGPQHRNTFGGAHGGFVAALVDVAVGRGTRAVLDDGRAFRTVSMTIDYLSAAEVGERLDFAVDVDHAARRTVFVTCRVSVGARLVARATVVLAASSA